MDEAEDLALEALDGKSLVTGAQAVGEHEVQAARRDRRARVHSGRRVGEGHRRRHGGDVRQRVEADGQGAVGHGEGEAVGIGDQAEGGARDLGEGAARFHARREPGAHALDLGALGPEDHRAGDRQEVGDDDRAGIQVDGQHRQGAVEQVGVDQAGAAGAGDREDPRSAAAEGGRQDDGEAAGGREGDQAGEVGGDQLGDTDRASGVQRHIQRARDVGRAARDRQAGDTVHPEAEVQAAAAQAGLHLEGVHDDGEALGRVAGAGVGHQLAEVDPQAEVEVEQQGQVERHRAREWEPGIGQGDIEGRGGGQVEGEGDLQQRVDLAELELGIVEGRVDAVVQPQGVLEQLLEGGQIGGGGDGAGGRLEGREQACPDTLERVVQELVEALADQRQGLVQLGVDGRRDVGDQAGAGVEGRAGEGDGIDDPQLHRPQRRIHLAQGQAGRDRADARIAAADGRDDLALGEAVLHETDVVDGRARVGGGDLHQAAGETVGGREGRDRAVAGLAPKLVPDLGEAGQVPEQLRERQDLVVEAQGRDRTRVLDRIVGRVDLLAVDDGDAAGADGADESVGVGVVDVQVEEQRVGGQALVGAVGVRVQEGVDGEEIPQGRHVLGEEICLPRDGGSGDGIAGGVDDVAGRVVDVLPTQQQVVGLVEGEGQQARAGLLAEVVVDQAEDRARALVRHADLHQRLDEGQVAGRAVGGALDVAARHQAAGAVGDQVDGGRQRARQALPGAGGLIEPVGQVVDAGVQQVGGRGGEGVGEGGDGDVGEFAVRAAVGRIGHRRAPVPERGEQRPDARQPRPIDVAEVLERLEEIGVGLAERIQGQLAGMEASVEKPLFQIGSRVVEEGAGEAGHEEQRPVDEGLDPARGQRAGDAALVDQGVGAVAAVEGHVDRGPLTHDQGVVAGLALDDDGGGEGRVEAVDGDGVVAIAGLDRQRVQRGDRVQEGDFLERAGAVAVDGDRTIRVADEPDLLVAGRADGEHGVGFDRCVDGDRLEAGVLDDLAVEADYAGVGARGEVARAHEGAALDDEGVEAGLAAVEGDRHAGQPAAEVHGKRVVHAVDAPDDDLRDRCERPPGEHGAADRIDERYPVTVEAEGEIAGALGLGLVGEGCR